MPGVLMRPSDGFEPILDTLSNACDDENIAADVTFVSYEGHDVGLYALARQVADGIRPYFREYNQVLPIALSFSGNLLNYVYAELNDPLLAKRPIIIDAPFGASTLKPAGSATRLLKYFRAPNSWGYPKLMQVPPRRVNIGNAGDFFRITDDPAIDTYPKYADWVEARAKKGLSGHSLALFISMVSAMADWEYIPFREDVLPIYVVCTDVDVSDTWKVYEESIREDMPDRDGHLPVARPKNDTVAQPAAANGWIEALEGDITVLAVRSTHGGFMERPRAWESTLSMAMLESLSAR